MARCSREERLHMRVAAEFAVRKGSLNLQIVNRRLPAASSDGVGKLTTLQERLEEARQALQVAERDLGIVRNWIRRQGLPLDLVQEVLEPSDTTPNVTTTSTDDERDSASLSDGARGDMEPDST